MFGLDDFTKNVFEEIRHGVPIIGSDYSSGSCLVDSFHGADGLAGQHPFQSSSLSATSSAANSATIFDSGLSVEDKRPFWDTIAPQDFLRRSDYLGGTAHYMPLVATSDTLTVNNVLVPPPTIVRRKRRIENYSSNWHTSKRARVDGLDAVGGLPSFPYPQLVSTDFRRVDYTEGNALKHNNNSTRASDFEEKFPIVGLAPVAEQSSVQGLWSMMTPSAASQRRPTQTPFMAAEYSSQFFPFPLGAQPSNAAPETLNQFRSTPDTTMGYGDDSFAQPSFIGELFTPGPSQALSWATTQQAPRYPAQSHLDETSFQTAGPSSFPSSVMPWPFGAAGENAFPTGPTPSLSTGYGVDPSFASVAEQPSDQDLVVPVQAPQTSATLPQPLPDPVAESSFGVASQGSSSSSSAPKPSNAAPQKKGKKKAQTPFLLAEAKCHLSTVCESAKRRIQE